MAPFHAPLAKRQVHKRPEPEPVALREFGMVRAVEPGSHLPALLFRKRLPEHFGCKQESIDDGCHLDEALVVVPAATPE